MLETYYIRETKFYDALHHYYSETDPNYDYVFVSDPHRPLYPAKKVEKSQTHIDFSISVSDGIVTITPAKKIKTFSLTCADSNRIVFGDNMTGGFLDLHTKECYIHNHTSSGTHDWHIKGIIIDRRGL